MNFDISFLSYNPKTAGETFLLPFMQLLRAFLVTIVIKTARKKAEDMPLGLVDY